MEFPLTIRMPYGGGVRAPELHDDSPETYYVHTPGIKVAIPSTPADAKGLLAAAIRDPDPVVILEPKLHYRTLRGEVPEGEHVVPLGKARFAREGTDLTLVAYGSMVPLCEQAADALADEASVEVLDIRSLKPLDEDALLASAAKTGRVVIVQEAPRVAGFGAELAAILAEKAILDLHGPVLRVTGYDVPYPVLADRGRVHAVGRARRGRGPEAPGLLMAYEFKLPDLGEGLTEGEIARWLVAEGDEIAEDQPLVEVQTDKTTVEIPSPAAGKVASILVAEGATVPVGNGARGDRRRRHRRRGAARPRGGGDDRARRCCTRRRPRPGDAARPSRGAGARRRPRVGHGHRSAGPHHRGRRPQRRLAGLGRAGRGRAPRAAARRPEADRDAPGDVAPRGAGGHGRRGVRLHRARRRARRPELPAVPHGGDRPRTARRARAERAPRRRRDRLLRALRPRPRGADRAGPRRAGRPRGGREVAGRARGGGDAPRRGRPRPDR